jgi:hypothetical protein
MLEPHLARTKPRAYTFQGVRSDDAGREAPIGRRWEGIIVREQSALSPARLMLENGGGEDGNIC